MPISLVQKATSGATSVLGTSISLAYSSNVTSGNLLVCVIGNGPVAAPNLATPTDTQGNTWTLAVSQTVLDGTDFVTMYYAFAGSTGANTVTSTGSGTPSDLMMFVFEYSGIVSPSPIDKTHGGLGNSAGNITTTNANDLLLSAIVGDGNVSGWSATNSFTVQETAVNSNTVNISMAAADQIVSAVGTYNTTFNGTGLTGEAAIIASFKAGAPAPPPGSLPFTELFLWQIQALPDQVFDWRSQFISHGMNGYHHIGAIMVAYIASANVTLSFAVFDGTAPANITLASTGGLYQRVWLNPTFNKGMLFRYIGHSSNPFQFVLQDWIAYVKPWGDTGPYQPYRLVGEG